MLRSPALFFPLLLAASAACRENRLPVVDGSNRDLAAGKIIFERKCVSCHGASGDGKTITAGRYKYANLIDGVWRSDGSSGALERQIRYGRDPMPRFERKLTDEEIRQTAAFVLELSRAARGAAPAAGSRGR
ncbi:MAG: c-type cytochrome [Thermoanaerobaculia bacterium]